MRKIRIQGRLPSNIPRDSDTPSVPYLESHTINDQDYAVGNESLFFVPPRPDELVDIENLPKAEVKSLEDIEDLPSQQASSKDVLNLSAKREGAIKRALKYSGREN